MGWSLEAGKERGAPEEEEEAAAAEGTGCYWCVSDKGEGGGSRGWTGTKTEGIVGGSGWLWRDSRAEGGGTGQLDRGRRLDPREKPGRSTKSWAVTQLRGTWTEPRGPFREWREVGLRGGPGPGLKALGRPR